MQIIAAPRRLLSCCWGCCLWMAWLSEDANMDTEAAWCRTNSGKRPPPPYWGIAVVVRNIPCTIPLPTKSYVELLSRTSKPIHWRAAPEPRAWATEPHLPSFKQPDSIFYLFKLQGLTKEFTNLPWPMIQQRPSVPLPPPPPPDSAIAQSMWSVFNHSFETWDPDALETALSPTSLKCWIMGPDPKCILRTALQVTSCTLAE